MYGSQYIWILCGLSLMLKSGALAGVLLKNVALKGTAVQSSTGELGAAKNAINGDRNPNYSQGSCSSTLKEANPWWRVDLQSVFQVTAVRVTNRNEVQNRLSGAEIWIGTSVDTNDASSFRCGVIAQIPKGDTVYISCGCMEGRYVTVLLRGSLKILTLCEVEVFPSEGNHLPNVALNGHAIQTGSYSSFTQALKAIDGNREPIFNKQSCSTTAYTVAPWWRVDLQKSYAITTVKVTNRGDCCPERLDGAEIRIGNSLVDNGNNNTRCATISHIRGGETDTFDCEGGSMEGRFVNVIIPGTAKKFLTLCEVEVYAVSEEEPLANVALNGKTAQSSNYSDIWGPSHAINGDRSGDLYEGPCTHTKRESSPWWRLDLLDEHKVRAVSVYDRINCCPERLIGAEILIGNSLNGTENSRCATILSTNGVLSHTFHCGDMEGRYIFVTIPGEAKTLTLCELEVYGSLAGEPTPPPPPTESMLLGGMNVTLVGKKLCWSDALLYCRRHYWDLLGLGSQEEQSEVEQLLTRASFPITDFVWIGLRRTLMGDDWFWMSGANMGFTKWVHEAAPVQVDNHCGGMVNGGRYLWVDKPCEEHFNFICQSGAVEGVQRVYFYSSRQDTSD